MRKPTQPCSGDACVASAAGQKKATQASPLQIEPLEPRRLMAAGLPDYSFGHAGQVVTTSGGAQGGEQVVVQSDGRFIVLAQTSRGTFLVRYLANGSLDNSFGKNARVKIDARLASGQMIQDRAGRLIVVARTVIARFDSDGIPDSTFGGTGIEETAQQEITAVVARSDGRLIVGDDNGIIRQYRITGAVDRGFGDDGAGGISLSDATGIQRISVVDLKRQSDGRIVVLCRANKKEPDLVIVRLTSSLQLDQTFAAGNGFVSFDLLQDNPQSLAIAADDRIVASDLSDSRDGILRLTKDGAFDATFGDAGFADLGGIVNSQANDRFPILVDPAGNVIAGGSVNYAFKVVRLNSSGAPDASFSYNGSETLAFGEGFEDRLRDMTLTPTGKILTVGGGGGIKLAQFDNEGVDPAFAAIINRTLTITGTPRNDTVSIERYHNPEEVQVGFNDNFPTFPASQISRVIIDTGSGDDIIEYVPFKPTTVTAGAGNDHIRCNFGTRVDISQRSTLSGGAGDDDISGDIRNNLILGGAGNDTLRGFAGNDTLDGGAGDDMLFADEQSEGQRNSEADQVLGGPGNDTAVLDSLDTEKEIEVL